MDEQRSDVGPLCCGCTCEKCSRGHSNGPSQHTDECRARFYAEQGAFK